jgi:replicative DNA helicase
MDTLKESGDLEYSADAVAFLTESEERMATAPARALTLTVAKNRHGETGAVDLIFRPDRGDMRPESYHAEPGGDGHAGGSPF